MPPKTNPKTPPQTPQQIQGEEEEKKEEYLQEVKDGIKAIRGGTNIEGLLSSTQSTISRYWEENNVTTFNVSDLVYEQSDGWNTDHKGAVKKAHKFSTNHGTRTLKRYVNSEYTVEEYNKDILVQRLSFLAALDFNKELREQSMDEIEVLHVVQQIKSEKIHGLDTLSADGKYYYTDEQWLTGTFDKFVSNTGEPFVDNEYAHAFAHYSLFYSGGDFLICDIQGHERTFTDCQIATIGDGGLTPSDLGSDAMMVFMAQHVCNGVCETLKLPNFKKRGSVLSCLDFTAFRNRTFEKNDEAMRTSARLDIGGGDGQAAFKLSMRSKVPFYVDGALNNGRRRIQELRVHGGLPADPFEACNPHGARHHVEDIQEEDEDEEDEDGESTLERRERGNDSSSSSSN